MAIVPLIKMTLFGSETQKASVIAGLQQLGCVHLIDLAEPDDGESLQGRSKEARDALRYLRDCPEQRRQVVRKNHFDRRQVIADVLDLKAALQRLSDERDELCSAIDDLEPWGNFQIPPEQSIGDVRFWFYEIPIHDLARLEETPYVRREISRDHSFARILILDHAEPKDIPGRQCELDERPLSVLRSRREKVEERIEELHHGRVGLTRWASLLENALHEADDLAARDRAMKRTLDEQNVFAVQGWAPAEREADLCDFAAENQLAVSVEPPAEDDEPPTLLHNPELLAGGEALVTFYKTPSYRAWDPSILAYGSFAIFFAMIMSDAGYGFVLALLAAYFWKPMGATQEGRRGRVVLATVTVVTMAFGVLCGSYFGVTPSEGSLLDNAKIIDVTSQSLMLPLTIVMGVIHLSLANITRAWSIRGRLSAIASLGWVAVMFGALLAGVASVDSGSESNVLSSTGVVLICGGLLQVFLFSSDRPLFSLDLKNHVLRIVDGLSGLTGLSGLFGDVLSYLRLFALGLSSAKLSATVNSLGADAWDSAGFGVIAALAIVILGHTINLVLGVMSGVVHGLRLVCIEFFKWSLPEDGHLFSAFAKKAKES